MLIQLSDINTIVLLRQNYFFALTKIEA